MNILNKIKKKKALRKRSVFVALFVLASSLFCSGGTVSAAVYDGGEESVKSGQNNSGYGFHGVYVEKNILGAYGEFYVTTDPGYLETKTTEQILNSLKSSIGKNVGENGRVIEYNNSFAIEIRDKVYNNKDASFGRHAFKAYHEYINFGFWEYFPYTRNCIHVNQTNNYDIYNYFNYEGKPLGSNGYGMVSPPICREKYEPGALGYCADCGARINLLVYASPETLGTFRRMRNGASYGYICPNNTSSHWAASQVTLSGENFKYLSGHIEQLAPMTHACTATCANQYYLQFESNSPNPSFFHDSFYRVGGYFYNIYEDGKDVAYVQEGSEIPTNFSSTTTLDDGSVIFGSIPIVKSKNAVPSSKFDGYGYIFKEWELYTGSAWVNVGANPTWKEIASKVQSSLLSKDGNVIRLRATWTTPSAYLKVVDGESTNVQTAPALASYEVDYMRSQLIGIPSDKSGTLSFVSGDTDVANPANMPITAKFSSFSPWSWNKGIYDSATRTYMNVDPTDKRTDYILASYAWQTISLPSLKKSGKVFMGWYTEPNGGGRFCGSAGAPYTPSGSATLYGYWLTDSMTIGAVVTDHVAGTSDVEWKYNNSNIAGAVFYKIYRNNSLITNGNSLGTTVNETAITFSDSSDTHQSGSYTVQTAGVYKIVLKGQAGKSATYGGTTASGGKGATYALTMLLKKGDILTYDLNPTSGNYGGGAGKLIRGSAGVAGNGGNAAVLKLNGNVVAVAGGGGGGAVLPNGAAIAGENAVQSRSSNAVKETSSDPYSSYTGWNQEFSVVSGGGGGGYYTGSYGSGITARHVHAQGSCYTIHNHQAGGGNLTSQGGYTASGGCYTLEQQITIRKNYTTRQLSINTENDNTNCPRCNFDNSGGVMKKTTITFGYTSDFDKDETTGWKVTTYCTVHPENGATITSGVYEAGKTVTGDGKGKIYVLGCGKGDGEQSWTCNSSTNWGADAISGSSTYLSSVSTGGSCWYDSGKIMSASFEADNGSVCGSISLESMLVGVTDNTSMVDTGTDDVDAPDAPSIGDRLSANEKPSADGKLADIYLSNISWNEVVDNGTVYRFRGETWDMMTAGYVKRCETSNDAVVTVTSGIDRYEYEVYVDGVKKSEGNTKNLFTGEIPCIYGQSKTTSYSHTLKIKVRAKDKAGNYSNWVEKSVTTSYQPAIPSPEHVPGVLDNPIVAVSDGAGVYKNGNTCYVKADGNTKLAMTVSAHLSSVQKSRIISVSLGDEGEDYGAGYSIKTSLTNHTAAGTTMGGGIGALNASGNGNLTVLTNSDTKAVQNFTTTREDFVVVKPYSEADCLGEDGKGCANPNHKLKSAGDPVTIVGDKTAPKVKIASLETEFIGTDNAVEIEWADKDVDITITATDEGSGIKKITVTNMLGEVLGEKSPTGRETTVVFPKTVDENGYTYLTVEVEDNVGNKTAVRITVSINKQSPTITDNTDKVSATNTKCFKPDGYTSFPGHHPSTKESAVWEYDWEKARTIRYEVEDDISGLKNVVFYQTNESYSKVVEVIYDGKKSFGEMSVSLSYEVITQGTTYYRIEAEGLSGKKTVVNIKVRIDDTPPVYTGDWSDARTHVDEEFENLSVEEATAALTGNGVASFSTQTDFKLPFADICKVSPMDSSGVAHATLYLYDETDEGEGNKEKWKSYEMDGRPLSPTSPRKNDFETKWDGNERYYNKEFTASINTFAEFPDSVSLKWHVEVEDNVGNKAIIKGKKTNGEDDIIPNYLIKAVIYATKNNAYNAPVKKNDKIIGNTPYFKNGELGFIEVWTIGYVEEIELDFSEGGVGVKCASEIERGAYNEKYSLGVHGEPKSERMVTTIKEHGVTGPIPNRDDGIPYAAHYVYPYESVENSVGTNDLDGWMQDGTFIRIPPAYSLKVRTGENGEELRDKDGNKLYEWEMHYARIYAVKGAKTSGRYISAPYVIWDESGDDVHYRLIHGTLGF